MKQTQDQNNKLIRKILLSYALTFTLINLADSLTMVADGMVISRGLGAAALAAVGLADPSYKIASLFAGVLSVGLQSMCAAAMGSGDKKKVNGIFSAGLAVTAAAAAVLTVLGFVFSGRLCRLFGAGNDPELSEHLHNYLKGWFTGLPGYLFFFVLSPLVTLDGNKKNMTAATLLQSTVNIAGDVLAVFVFRAGTYGVGIATGLAYNVSACVLFLNFIRKSSVFKLFSSAPDFSVLPKTIRLGLPMITQQACRIAAPLIINHTVIAIGGSLAMSAISVKAGMMGFCVILGNGVAESVGLMTRILYSEKDSLSLKQTIKGAFGVNLSLNTLLSLLIFIFAGFITVLYFPRSTREWALSSTAVRYLAVSLPLNGCNQILMQYLTGANKMMTVHVMTFFHRMLSLTIFTVVLGHFFSVTGLLAAIPISEAAVLIGYLLVALLPTRSKKHQTNGRDRWDQLLKIPDGFGYNNDNSFAASISTVEEAVAISERIEYFCSAHGVDKRKSYFSARCMEELSTNVIERGFTDDKKHHCDIRVMIAPDEVVLRLRDDCPYFNIRERYDALAEDDIDAGVWIRMVFALAKDVDYINIFNTNTLIIRM